MLAEGIFRLLAHARAHSFFQLRSRATADTDCHSLSHASLDWAAEEDDNQQVASSKTPASGIVEERDEGNGVKVVVEYKTNEDGKKVKVSRGRFSLLCPCQTTWKKR